MRKTVVLLVLMMILAVSVGVAGCGGSSEGAPSAGADSPQSILSKTLNVSDVPDSATGTFDVSLTLDMDTSQFPDDMKKLFDNPITLSGTFASDEEPMAAEADLSLGLGGESMNLAVKSTDTQAWIRLNGQWYEAPAEMMQSMGEQPQAQAQMDEMMKLITDLGVDPVTWVKDLSLVGEDELDGVKTYHLKGSPDMVKIVADVMGLMKSEEFMAMMNGAMDSAGSLGLDSMMPSPDELQEAQDTISQVFKDFVFDMWVGKDDSIPRKITLSAQIVPPAGEETQGLNGVGITATFTFGDIGKAVDIKAPESALSSADLEQAMQENPEQFLGPLAPIIMGMGMGMGTDMGTN